MEQAYETPAQTKVEEAMQTLGGQVSELLQKSSPDISVAVAATMDTGKPGEVYSFVSATGENVARSVLVMLMSDQFMESGVTASVLDALKSIQGDLRLEHVPTEELN